MYLNNKYKLIVVTYKKQKIFNVVIINYKNFFVYIQRQIDCLFCLYRKFIKNFINNIIVYFDTLQKYFNYFC